jgi:coenzyme PQQ biosynthesis protein PqqD
MLRFKRGVRIQFEKTTNINLLLFPEGVVELNDSAHAILSRLPAHISSLKRELQTHYNMNDLEGIDDFVEYAKSSSWVQEEGVQA